MTVITKFAVQYSLVPRHPADDLGILFAAAIEQWHTKKRMNVPTLSWDSPTSGRLGKDALFRWAPYAQNGEAIADYSLRHADSMDPQVSWITRFSYLAQREQSTTSPYAGPTRYFLTVHVAVEGPDELARKKVTSRPSFISILDEVFALGDGDLEFRKKARALSESEIGDFVQYTLEDPQRRFPIVVISESKSSGFLFDPVSIASQYFGVAHVYTIGWRGALALTAEVGSSRSVFKGAMRVYFPAFRRSKSPSSHPLVPVGRLAEPLFTRRLAAAITEETVSHFVEAAAPSRELSEKRVMAYDATRSKMAAELRASVPPSELKAYQELLQEYDSEAQELRRKLTAAENTIANLDQKLTALRHAFAQVKGGVQAKEDSAIRDLLEEEPPSSPIEAVERAAAMTMETLNILPSAYETAEESGYTQPAVILDYLLKMGMIAEKKRLDTLGTSLREAFSAYGIDYAPKNSENTKGKLRAQYRFKDGDSVFTCEEHLRKGNDPSLGLRIYFNSDGADGRFVVGHVGRHLDSNTTT